MNELFVVGDFEDEVAEARPHGQDDEHPSTRTGWDRSPGKEQLQERHLGPNPFRPSHVMKIGPPEMRKEALIYVKFKS